VSSDDFLEPGDAPEPADDEGATSERPDDGIEGEEHLGLTPPD
jgi:hypothetical protein